MSEKNPNHKKESWWSPRNFFKWTLLGLAGTMALELASHVVGKVFAAGSALKRV